MVHNNWVLHRVCNFHDHFDLDGDLVGQRTLTDGGPGSFTGFVSVGITVRFAVLMREVTNQNGGLFLALPKNWRIAKTC